MKQAVLLSRAAGFSKNAKNKLLQKYPTSRFTHLEAKHCSGLSLFRY
jgi:hypothetical protein